MLEGLGVVEVLRRLHQRDAVVPEVGQRAGEEVRLGDVVGIEDGDQLGLHQGQRVVEVAGLGVVVLAAGDVPCAEGVGHLGHLRAVAVVEDPGLVVAVHGQDGGHRGQQDLQSLVVGGDQHGDAGSGSGPQRHPHPGALGGDVPGGEDEQHERDETVQLEEEEGHADHQGGARGHGPPDAPDQVPHRGCDGGEGDDVQVQPAQRALRRRQLGAGTGPSADRGGRGYGRRDDERSDRGPQMPVVG
nr:hypothetical protein [Modestobacter sp. DSM 44400]